MKLLPVITQELIVHLKKSDIDPVLYGSQGVSIYLGSFKKFGDIDLLVDEDLICKNWAKLQTVMRSAGYALVDQHEHEFLNDAGQRASFASEQILIRDKILMSLNELVKVTAEGTVIRTLSASDFMRAYRFSLKDGYRKDVRAKDDQRIITLLQDYVAKNL